MTRSRDFPDLLDLDRGLPTTPEDVAALRRLRERPPMTLEEYFLFCQSLPQPSQDQLAARRGPGGAPFRLP